MNDNETENKDVVTPTAAPTEAQACRRGSECHLR
jgi:hypothetical protein